MLSATTKRRLKMCGCTLAAVVIVAVVWFAVGFYLLIREQIDWEVPHGYMTGYKILFENEPGLAAKLSETPLEVTDISLAPLSGPQSGWNKGDPPYRDRHGNPMRFFLIRWNDRIYGKGISAGRDGKFGTADDIVSSDYDDTNNPHYCPLVDIEKKKFSRKLPPKDVPSDRK